MTDSRRARLLAWGRIYMEAVEEDGIDLDEPVRRMAVGDPRAGG